MGFLPASTKSDGYQLVLLAVFYHLQLQHSHRVADFLSLRLSASVCGQASWWSSVLFFLIGFCPHCMSCILVRWSGHCCAWVARQHCWPWVHRQINQWEKTQHKKTSKNKLVKMTFLNREFWFIWAKKIIYFPNCINFRGLRGYRFTVALWTNCICTEKWTHSGFLQHQ